MSAKVTKKEKFLFTLTEIDIPFINTTYGIVISCNDKIISDKDCSNTTKLTELNTEKGTPDIVSFLDESKKLHICHISMIDFDSKMNVNLLRYNCFWCKHPFESRPIGCPLKFVSSQVEKRYHSHISRDTYTIKENITGKNKLDLANKEQLCIHEKEYYETDGVFCSFNCCQAWIDDNKHNRLYDLSSTLLIKMYNNIMGTKTVVISPSPHWRLLEQYGGHLNIIKFREGFNKIDYECHGNTKMVPVFNALGTLFEEKIKF
jgi:hypothetical protein